MTEIEELKQVIKDLTIRVSKLEKSVTIKNRKWDVAEGIYLLKLASTASLSKDDVRTRSTKYLFMVQAFQQTYEDRTEYAIKCKLDKVYFS